MKTTNYTDTFIAVAEDCRAERGTVPPVKGAPSIAALTFALIQPHPYRYTSDDVLFQVHAERAGIPESERAEARSAYFAEGRACLRASPLGKTYGWGIHSDAQGRVALYGVESEDYQRLALGQPLTPGSTVRVTRAMRSSRA